MLHLDQSKTVRNEQGTAIGTITPLTDEHGNRQFYTTTVHREDDETVFWAQSAARFWLDIVDATASARLMRGARS